MGNRPPGELARRPLQFIWILDCSGSMQGNKIESLNYAVQSAIEPMQKVANDNPNAQVFVRVICFSDGAQWEISQPTDIHDFKWRDLDADGVTDMGKALTMVAEALSMKNMPDRGLPPVLVLVSDGQPTDDYASALKALMKEPWGKRAVRIAVAIGDDADADVLRAFIGNPEIAPLTAHNSEDLKNKIKWASTAPLKAASSPASHVGGDSGSRIKIDIPQPGDTPPDGSGVF